MEENKDVVEETTQATEQPVEESKFDSAGDDSVYKIDLSKPPKTKEDAVPEQSTDEVPVRDESETSGEVQEENEKVVEELTGESSDKVQDETPVIEEVTDEKVEEKVEELVEETKEAIAEAQETGKELPENVQKLMDFMEETGGSLEDYVRLNQDYSQYDDMTILREYYKQTKKHLDDDEISFLMEDSFSYDEEIDEPKDIKKKKIALKEQVASAKAYLDGQKSKYYDEIKAGSNLTAEQQEAIQFFNQYNEDAEAQQQLAKERSDYFINETNQVLNDNFKGFEYNVDGKKLNVKVPNPSEVARKQSDINNFINKFLNKDNTIKDVEGYHKALYAAMNPDVIAKHFYEQGKADAIQDSVANAKNVNMDARQSFSNESTGGIKVRVLSDDTPSFKFKKRN